MVVPIIENGRSELNGTSLSPSAPPFEGIANSEVPLNNEIPYVSFRIEQNKQHAVVMADKRAIEESKSELSKMISSGGSARWVDGQVVITGADKATFELLVRYIETKFIKFRNTNETLGVLELANRFTVPALVILCVKDLDLNLCVENVVEIFHSLWYYNSIIPPRKSLETKPNKKNDAPPLITPEEYIAAVLHNCLQFIDMEADVILSSTELQKFPFGELEVIVKRETLQLKSELLLFDLLAKWSLKECERKGLDITAENRRRVLGALVYCPRYLMLSAQDFESICNRVELLDSDETNLIRGEFKKHNKQTDLTRVQKNMLRDFQTRRPRFAKMPIHLSARSHPKNYSRKMRRYDHDREAGCCESMILNFCSVFTCIFD